MRLTYGFESSAIRSDDEAHEAGKQEKRPEPCPHYRNKGTLQAKPVSAAKFQISRLLFGELNW